MRKKKIPPHKSPKTAPSKFRFPTAPPPQFPLQPPSPELPTTAMFQPGIEYPFPPHGAAESRSAPDRVVVAVKAEKVISKTALAWALTHVVHPGDCVTLLAVYPEPKTSKKFWSFPRLTGDRGGSNSHRGQPESDRVCEISESCSQMLHNQTEVRVRIKVVSGTSGSAVAAEAKQNEASWVVVDKKLKQELKHCLEELQCNIVLMKGSQAKVLRLNLGDSNEPQTPYFSATSSPDMELLKSETRRMKHSTPVSSPDQEQSSGGSHLTTGSSLSSYSPFTPPLLVYEENPPFDVGKRQKPVEYQSGRFEDSPVKPKNSRTLLAKFLQGDQDGHEEEYSKRPGVVRRSSALSLGRTSSVSPPLCSFCQHKAPVFGKPPREFSYEELDDATGGFSDGNFLAKGGFGDVYRGVLSDGQVVAVKVLRFLGAQADADFCREVKVLSCAQHRNVVLLIGFCVDAKKRMLVYEYICNGSLDFHLHGNRRANLDWHSRLKIAVGTARGLRYLHEDCRVGCIVHRDMRPDNILLTHDFEPLVADFGLARRHSDWQIETEDRVIGTSGYLAPEYVNEGNVTDKVDVYAFGVILLELLTGRRINELQFANGQHLLFSNWFVSHTNFPNQLLDPRLLMRESTAYPINAMARAASLCLHLDPDFRPPMSKVLSILEGGDHIGAPLSLDLNSAGNRSGYLRGLGTRRCHSRKLSQ